MTQPRNAANTDSFFRRTYPNTALNSINQGDGVYEDPSTFDVKALDSDAHAVYFVGISDETYPGLAEVPNLPKDIAVLRWQRVKMFLKNGDTATCSCSLYWGGDAQTVSVTGSNKIGTLSNLPDHTQDSVVGTGTNLVYVDLYHSKN